MHTKKCTKCLKVKDTSEFHKRKGGKHKPQCKACAKAYSARRWAKIKADPTRYKEVMSRSKAWRQANPDKVRDYIHKSRQKYPERLRAKLAIQYAISTGKLTRPDECSRCRAATGKIEAHHPDYTKRLEVIWLCRSCHAEEHRQGMEQMQEATLV